MQGQDTTNTRHNSLRLTGTLLSFKLYWIVHGKITASDKCAVVLWPRLSHFRTNKNEQCMNECVDNFCRISTRAPSASLFFLVFFFFVIYFGKYQIQPNLAVEARERTNTHNSHQRPHTCTEQCQNRSFIVQHTFVVLHFYLFGWNVNGGWLWFHCVRCELP